MASRLTKIFAPLALAVLLTGCSESTEDLAKKPALVAQMVENSVSICETGPVHADKAAYEERLTKVLMDAKTASLQTLKDNNVTVCLDQRLSQQTHGFFKGRLDGVYYGEKNGGVAALWDDGRQPAETSIFSMDAYFRGDDAVNHLASKIAEGKQAADGGYMGAYEYGKTSTIYWSLRDPAKGTLGDNPQLREPPLKSPPPKPAS